MFFWQIIPSQIPRCLRQADSETPHKLKSRSNSLSQSPPLEAITALTTIHTKNNNVMSNNISSSSSNNSSGSTSSGVHSNESNVSSQRRATSVEDLTSIEPREEPNWRSCSLQRGIQPPTSATSSLSSSPAKFNNSGKFIANLTVNYASYAPLYNGEIGKATGCPAILLENEATVVIRRKNAKSKLQETPSLIEDPFGRSTNMRMTSFTENNDLRAMQASSATLPHYPTQPIVMYPHCSTMPLPHASSHNVNTSISTSNVSSGSVPRHPGNFSTNLFF